MKPVPSHPDRPKLIAWAWIGLAALLLLSLYFLREERRMQRELAGLHQNIALERARREALEHERKLTEQAYAILAASDTQQVKLDAAPGAPLPDMHAFWNPGMGVVVVGQKIPGPNANRTFQLWVAPAKGTPVSAGIFLPDNTGRVLLVATPSVVLTSAATLSITDEPAGGRPQPTSKPLWLGRVT